MLIEDLPNTYRDPTFPLWWSAAESTITEATTALLYQPRMMMDDDDECGTVRGILGKEN
jgi:hypothetical protein